MMTQEQNVTFRRALEMADSSTEFEAIDDRMLIAESAVTQTAESVSNFVAARGPATVEVCGPVKLHVWRNVQTRKGARRGDLFVADFGDYRLAHFSGEA